MKRVGLFCGGYSSEFEISLKSAQTIMDHFPDGYEVIPVHVVEDGWFVPLNGEKFPFSIDHMSYRIHDMEYKIDIGLIYIHGNPGENGKIQALLDMKNIPYVNSNALASELSFDKWYCNQFLSRFGIPVAKSLFLKTRHELTSEAIIAQLGLPCFVKPSDSGSSFGISKVSEAGELQPALDKAFEEGNTVVIEAFLNGTEVTCGIYRSPSGLVTLPLTEIVSENDFFDYEAKYLGQSQEITPARIPDSIRNIVWERSKEIYSLLQLRSIVRIDFMIVNEVPHVIEVNTTPGFSPASLVPQMLTEAGISIADFWTEIFTVELA
ncbi:D-alanine--D-alanine ligase [Fluviicola sp.]|jgi:D-alanine-D-alanine ligase|uniref:D-alanine--D-alanine ligase n=1 Tax=Fluviicola sp. TaxID=1917219 RepID=UPI00281DF9AD|nr:D-alanine--D-alanine ligase [Fluviicola sp.]MDR0802403.1 D-alanine--D-alanine ligase [Fluviicola sp.]